MPFGFCFWITGLAGSGKTTLAKRALEILRSEGLQLILLDGDHMRDVFSNNNYSKDSRIELAKKYSNLSKNLNLQGFSTICSTISLFDEIFTYNRQNIPNYKEIFLSASEEVLNRRDKKGLYSGFESGKIKNVVGRDIACNFPENPDLKIVSEDLDRNVEILCNFIRKTLVDT